MVSTALFSDLSAEEAETVNGAHGYYYQFAGYVPVYRRRRIRRRHYYYSHYRPRRYRSYSSYRTVYYSGCY